MDYRIPMITLLLVAGCAPLPKTHETDGKKKHDNAIALYEKNIASHPFELEPYLKLYTYEITELKDTVSATQVLKRALIIAPPAQTCGIIDCLRNTVSQNIGHALASPSPSVVYLENTLSGYSGLLDLYRNYQCPELTRVDSANADDIARLKLKLARKYTLVGNVNRAMLLVDETLASAASKNAAQLAEDTRISILMAMVGISAGKNDTTETIYLLSRIKELTGNKDNRLAEVYERVIIGYATSLMQSAAGSTDNRYRENTYSNCLSMLNRITGPGYGNNAKARSMRFNICLSLSALKEQQDRLPEAIDYLNVIISESVDTSMVADCKTTRRALYFRLAEWSYNRENYGDAVRYLNKILAELPNDTKTNELRHKIKLMLSRAVA
ncbi:MAG TPA: hypothetical protein VLD19_10375 [Chitinophagaceae bacterium]|nr:hypothetical protein [Chitinophagaceae bacterium]